MLLEELKKWKDHKRRGLARTEREREPKRLDRLAREDAFYRFKPGDGPVMRFCIKVIFWTPIIGAFVLLTLASYWIKTTFVWS